MYKSERIKIDQNPKGSELWHADGGPGTCMNLMICHTPVNMSNGAMKIINWKKSKKLLSKLFFEYKLLIKNKNILNQKYKDNRTYLREQKCELLKGFINRNSINYFQPNSPESGTIFAFSNNSVHSGGYTELGHRRIVSVMHIYPSTKKTSLEEKFNHSHIKTLPYPEINKFI